ncbi:MAG TPA: hypothetical protein VD999_00385 [Vitreimonas sp.]|nr:hypothetical protein [Vitreimonas sp.]
MHEDENPWEQALKGTKAPKIPQPRTNPEWDPALGQPAAPRTIWDRVAASFSPDGHLKLTLDEFQTEAQLKEYKYHSRLDWGFWKNVTGQPEPDIGYKLHLNVKPSNAKSVSEFLMAHDYEHKFLQGGEIDDGKIFTVYTGSLITTQKIAAEISANLSTLLEPGVASGEVAFDPQRLIVGRFCGEKQYFRTKRCNEGINLLIGSEDPAAARAKAQELYGSYFAGL